MGTVRFSAVVLAAGSSTRMQGRHKLLLPLGDEPVIRRTVREVLASGPVETIVVTGHGADEISGALAGLSVTLRFNPRHAEGQMTSVAAGVAGLAAPVDAIMVCLGDMALLRSGDYRELAEAYGSRPLGTIVVPHRDAMRGNPVVFASSLAAEAIGGERNFGCRKLIADHPEEVFAWQPAHDRYFVDLDTPEDYARLVARVPAAA